jgi:exopolysaccharide biosynthesis protein
MTFREADFDTLYGVPQNIVMLELSPKRYHFDVLVHIPRVTVDLAGRETGAVAAINGGFFNKDGTPSTYLRKDGMTIGKTETEALGTVVNGAVQIWDGRVSITSWGNHSVDTCSQVGGTVLVAGPVLVQGGHDADFSTVYNKSFINTRHPRSVMAIQKNGNILLLVVTGRFPGRAEGINLIQLRHLMRILGSEDAINLDGGGSSTLWTIFAPDNGVLNKPTDNKIYDNQGLRAVGNTICVYTDTLMQ